MTILTTYHDEHNSQEILGRIVLNELICSVEIACIYYKSFRRKQLYNMNINSSKNDTNGNELYNLNINLSKITQMVINTIQM